MLREILTDIFSRRTPLWERLLLGVVTLSIMLGFGMICWLLLTPADRLAVSPTLLRTVVDSKAIIPPHTTTTVVWTGKIAVPISQSYPEAYRISLKINGEDVHASIDKQLFEEIRPGDTVVVEYEVGRLSGSYFPLHVRLPTSDK